VSPRRRPFALRDRNCGLACRRASGTRRAVQEPPRQTPGQLGADPREDTARIGGNGEPSGAETAVLEVAAPRRSFRQNGSMAATKIPTIILGGSDLRPAGLPASAGGLHPLSAYKGVAVRVGGRPLIAHLVDRLRGCPEFDPIYIAGPERIYGRERISASIIDTDSTFADNIRTAVDTVRCTVSQTPLAFIASDILPASEELRAFLDNYLGQGDCDLWYPLVRAPGDAGQLKAFGWKPQYRIRPGAGGEAVRVLPGHLLVADPAALRLRFIYRLLEVAYQTRNRPVAARHGAMVRRVVLSLVGEDLRQLLVLRAPTRTYTTLRNALFIARRLAAGNLSQEELELALTEVAVEPHHRKRFPGRGIRLPILEGLSFAEDIDTAEEAGQLVRDYAPGREAKSPEDREE